MNLEQLNAIVDEMFINSNVTFNNDTLTLKLGGRTRDFVTYFTAGVYSDLNNFDDMVLQCADFLESNHSIKYHNALTRIRNNEIWEATQDTDPWALYQVLCKKIRPTGGNISMSGSGAKPNRITEYGFSHPAHTGFRTTNLNMLKNYINANF